MACNSPNLLPWCLLALFLVVAPTAAAQTITFVEDFTSKQFCDTTLTTAVWDTMAGEVRLPPFVPTSMGHFDTAGLAHSLALAGDHAFIADDANGLVVLDISDPSLPVLDGAYAAPGNVRSVAIAGDHAYLAAGGSGLLVLDIRDATAPSLAGSYDTAGNATDVVVAGDRAYVADGGNGLVVVDISDPTRPVLAGSLDTDGSCRRLDLAGDHLYVADGTSVDIIDVSDPALPSLAGTYAAPGDARDVAVAGDYAYVADLSNHFQVLDVSDKGAPTLVAHIPTPGEQRGLTLAGNRAYLADGSGGLHLIDITDPTSPVILSSWDTSSESFDVVFAGELAFVADDAAGLMVVSVADAYGPFDVSHVSTNGNAVHLAIAGDHAYVANYTSDLCVVDISDPTAPVLAGSYDQGGVVYDVAVAGDRLFTTGAHNLCAFDISDPVSFVPLDSLSVVGSGQGLVLAGDHAYVAAYDGDLQVFDISDPASLALAASLPLPGWALDVFVAGDHAYVGTVADGLQVVDISDPTAPAVVGDYSLVQEVHGVAVAGNHAYLANEEGGFVVLDVKDPTNPTLAGSCATVGWPRDVVIVGDNAFLATAVSSKMEKIDISDPTNPTSVGTLNIGTNTMGIAASGQYVYVGHWYSGLWAVRIAEDIVTADSRFVQSLDRGPLADDVLLTSLTATVNDSAIEIETSHDGGLNWQTATGSETWDLVANPGSGLLWRSNLSFSATINPTISDLEIGLRYEFPVIESVPDVPGDQGGVVRVNFIRSGHDFAKPSDVIASYNVLRRVDTPQLKAELTGIAPGIRDGLSVRELGDRRFVVGAVSPDKAGLSGGTWEIMGSFNALQQDRYIFPTVTLADSGATVPYAVFCITAHTTDPLVWYASQPDSGYSVDNLAPGIPAGITAAYAADAVELDWEDAPEPDFRFFRVYRGTDPGFVPGPVNLVQEIAASAWTDPAITTWGYHYKITAVDHNGNEGEPGAPADVSGTGNGVPPAATALGEAVPNPFNPSTTLSFAMATPGHARLRVYDTAGRLVATLVDGLHPAGNHVVVWDGRDAAGRVVASGVYLYRLEAGAFRSTRKMVLMK